MNEIKANELAAQSVKSLTSSPQVQMTKQDASSKAKAALVTPNSGKDLPLEESTKPEEARNVEMKEAVSKLNEYVQKTQRNLDFSLDEDSGKTVIRVYDRQSEQLVRQIPDEVALELAKKLNSEEPALLFSAQV
jgi:flagellar protein FlaG